MKSAALFAAAALALCALASSAPVALHDEQWAGNHSPGKNHSGTGGIGCETGQVHGKSTVMGFIGIATAAIGFGSNFVVIKNKEWSPGDGMFFQFNMVVGVFMTGLIYHYFIRGAPPLQPSLSSPKPCALLTSSTAAMIFFFSKLPTMTRSAFATI